MKLKENNITSPTIEQRLLIVPFRVSSMHRFSYCDFSSELQTRIDTLFLVTVAFTYSPISNESLGLISVIVLTEINKR